MARRIPAGFTRVADAVLPRGRVPKDVKRKTKEPSARKTRPRKPRRKK